MTDEVKTIGEVERIVHGSGLWDGTGSVEFADHKDGPWSEAWAPTVDEESGQVTRDHPEYARVTVYRKDVRQATRVTIRWDEQRPRENDEWAEKWDTAPTRHFGRTARMVGYRQTFRDILGDIRIEDEDAPARDWAGELANVTTLEEWDTLSQAARAARAFTPDKAGTDLDIAFKARRRDLSSVSVKAHVEEVGAAVSVRPQPQDHLPSTGNRATRRKNKRGRR